MDLASTKVRCRTTTVSHSCAIDLRPRSAPAPRYASRAGMDTLPSFSICRRAGRIRVNDVAATRLHRGRRTSGRRTPQAPAGYYSSRRCCGIVDRPGGGSCLSSERSRRRPLSRHPNARDDRFRFTGCARQGRSRHLHHGLRCVRSRGVHGEFSRLPLEADRTGSTGPCPRQTRTSRGSDPAPIFERSPASWRRSWLQDDASNVSRLGSESEPRCSMSRG